MYRKCKHCSGCCSDKARTCPQCGHDDPVYHFELDALEKKEYPSLGGFAKTIVGTFCVTTVWFAVRTGIDVKEYLADTQKLISNATVSCLVGANLAVGIHWVKAWKAVKHLKKRRDWDSPTCDPPKPSGQEESQITKR